MNHTINRILLVGTLLSLTTWATPPLSANASPLDEQAIETQARRPVTLKFAPTETNVQVRKINVPATDFPKTAEAAIRHLAGAERLLKGTKTELGTVVLYSKREDPGQFYGAFLSKDTLYEFGPIGSVLSIGQTMIEVSRGVGPKAPILRITGQFGANVEATNYFYFVGQEIKPLLVVEGNVIEVDLDGDGSDEVITSGGIPSMTTIYKFIEGTFQEANLNEQLQALSVQSNRKNPHQFTVTFKGAPAPVTYEYVKGTLRPLSQ